MPWYTYKYVNGIVLTKWVSDEIINNVAMGLKEFDVYVDFGLSKVHVAVLDNKTVALNNIMIPI